MVLVQKWPFSNFFFMQDRPWKCLLRYSSTKKAFLGCKNKKFKNSKNWHFSKGVKPWFWYKNGHYSNFLLLGNVGQENVLYDILERKNAFLRFKNKNFKSRKIEISPKGLTYGFGPKMAIFQTIFLRQYRPGKCLLLYSRTKKPLSRT